MATDFHLNRAQPARALGRVAPIAGVGVLVLVGASALIAGGTVRTVVLVLAWTLVGGGCTLTAVAAWRLMRPPVLVRLDDHGLRVRVLRGAGPAEVSWADVSTVRRERLSVGGCVVIDLHDSQRTVVPDRLVDEGGDALLSALTLRLDTAHGQRRLGAEPLRSRSPEDGTHRGGGGGI